MGYLFLVYIGPLSSIGSPITFIILPSVSSPTGIDIGFPVSVTCYPLTRPSVESIAIVLTLESPKCYATSRINGPSVSASLTTKAFRIAGSCPEN